MPAPMEMATKYAVNATGSTMKQNTPPAFVRRATSLMRINPMNTMAQGVLPVDLEQHDTLLLQGTLRTGRLPACCFFR